MFLSRRKNRKMNVNLNHVSPTTLAPGNLVPLSFVRIIPGDDVEFSPSAFVQAMPMNAPLVNGFKLCFEYFFIPDRLYNWDLLMDNTGVTGNPDSVKFPCISTPTTWQDGLLRLDFTSINSGTPSDPQFVARSVVSPHSLADYCGFPVGMLPVYGDGRNSFSFVKMAGYLDIYYHYYLNQQLEYFPTASYNNKRYTSPSGDYHEENIRYSSSLLRSFLDVVKRSVHPEDSLREFENSVDDLGTPSLCSWEWLCSRASIFQRCLPPYYLESWLATSGYEDSEIKVDLEKDGNSISFRNISAMSHVQRWLDLAIAGGSRNSDYINAQFDVSRLKNTSIPYYLGSDRQYLGSNVIYQTTGADNPESPLGAFAGQSSGGSRFRDRTYHFGEYGYFMVMASLVPDVIYSRGLDPFLRELSYGDMYTPALDNIAMEPLMIESLDALGQLVSLNPNTGSDPGADIYSFKLQPDSVISNASVGYVPAWSRLMQQVSRSHGRLTTELRYWLLGRRYGDSIEDISNEAIVGRGAYKDLLDNLSNAFQNSELSAEELEALSAFVQRLEANSSYSPYILPNRYNDVFADQTNQAQNFVLTATFDMRANREKGKVNVPTTI